MVCLSVSLLVTGVSCAETAKPNQMPFGDAEWTCGAYFRTRLWVGVCFPRVWTLCGVVLRHAQTRPYWTFSALLEDRSNVASSTVATLLLLCRCPGVGGIEAEAVLLGQSVSMVLIQQWCGLWLPVL